MGCSPVLVAGWLLRVTHSRVISGCLTRGLLTACYRSGFSLWGLALGYAVTDSGDVRSPSDRSVAVGVPY